MFIVKPHKSCLITYLGIVFGVLAIYFAFTKVIFSSTCYLRYSLICLMLSGICDMFDGKFARACKRSEQEKQIGIQLDSLADTFCFIAVPVLIMFSLKMYSIPAIIIYILFIICGVTRLAHFNTIADADQPVKSYKGLPVTSTAITYPLLGLLHTVVDLNVLSIIYLSLTLLTAILFVLKINVPKLKGMAYIIVPVLALVLLILLILL